MKTPKTIVLLLSTLLGLVSCLPSSMIYPTVTPVPQVTHLIDKLKGIEPIWALDHVYIISNEQDVTLDSLMGITCFLGDLGKRELYKNFVCLESQGGKVLWSKQNGVQSTIAITPDGIFIAYSSPAELKKFDLETGDLLESRKLGGTGSIYLTYLNDQIQVSTTNPESLWILNTNAEIMTKIRIGEYTMLLSTPDETYVYLKGLQALQTDTKDVLWEHVDMRSMRQVPIFTEDKIFLRNGSGLSGTAYALDRHNEKLLWNISNIIGNLVYSPDKQSVYALRENGDLLTIDAKTGNENILATFSPTPFLFFDGVDTCAYQLAYDSEKHILLVYLGDSKQLFAFKVE